MAWGALLERDAVHGIADGGEPAYHLVFQVELAGPDDLGALLSSGPFQEAVRDVQEMMQRFGTTVTVMTGDDL